MDASEFIKSYKKHIGDLKPELIEKHINRLEKDNKIMERALELMANNYYQFMAQLTQKMFKEQWPVAAQEAVSVFVDKAQKELDAGALLAV